MHLVQRAHGSELTCLTVAVVFLAAKHCSNWSSLAPYRSKLFRLFLKSDVHSRVWLSILSLRYVLWRGLTWIGGEEPELCNHLHWCHGGPCAVAITIGPDRGVHSVYSHHLSVFVRCVAYLFILAWLPRRKPQSFVNMASASQVHHLSILLSLFHFIQGTCVLFWRWKPGRFVWGWLLLRFQ